MPDTADVPEAPVITSSDPESFPHSVLAERHPALIRRVRDAFPYGPAQHRALDALLKSATEGVIEALDGDAWWEAWGVDEYAGRTWFEVPFLWSESYFYRRLLHAVGHFGSRPWSAPWQGVDPFRPFKLAELAGPEAREEISALDRLAALPLEEQRTALLHGSLWGNRADLGFRIQKDDDEASAAELVADDSDALWQLLTGAGTLVLVADNAGRELVPDLLLVDHLLSHGHIERAVLHVKPYPYYVSDATTADVVDAVRHLTDAGTDHGRRLWSAMADGRIDLRAHPFSCGPLPYADMPDDLRAEFAAADVTVLKGDLNYRRLVGDRMWPPTTPFADVTAYFPGPVAALRTLKSDVITGLAPETEARLVAAEGQWRWRTSGTHALIQVRS
ncbi:damage-control phosphatase ARMT1 family protein [Streptomyces poonensis]|uniref:Damage-control phosphatase ARMT1-like metal-binding domain-containing protein n=1 Tax=Streptomyces poonensis TaxID=68255 RepID=A0A918PXF9_9ACTN|nr:damage-control phosphatase ARMT1 family protein [Streptomyces poonensis]GGZ26609.1 hypothetical protein GCM10010365_53770 [Streptomyces poonensis]GLJ93568.1 hypothetical protein GCM10017589_61830 [Streptomyces poonensis]